MGAARKRDVGGYSKLMDKAAKCLHRLFELAPSKKRNYILDQVRVNWLKCHFIQVVCQGSGLLVGGLSLSLKLTSFIFSRPMFTFLRKRKRFDLLKDLTDELLCVFLLKKILKREQRTERKKALNCLRTLSVTWKVRVKRSTTYFSQQSPDILKWTCWENSSTVMYSLDLSHS